MNFIEVKIISIRQPWVWAILNLGKGIENRSRPTDYRGRIYLHASKTYDREGQQWLEREFDVNVPDAKIMKSRGLLGCIQGAADIIDCQPSNSIWARPGQCHIHLDNIHRTFRYPLRGQVNVPFTGKIPGWVTDLEKEVIPVTYTAEDVKALGK